MYILIHIKNSARMARCAVGIVSSAVSPVILPAIATVVPAPAVAVAAVIVPVLPVAVVTSAARGSPATVANQLSSGIREIHCIIFMEFIIMNFNIYHNQ